MNSNTGIEIDIGKDFGGPMKYPETKILNTSEEIINDKDFDLVVIPTPNTSHHLLPLLTLLDGFSGAKCGWWFFYENANGKWNK